MTDSPRRARRFPWAVVIILVVIVIVGFVLVRGARQRFAAAQTLQTAAVTTITNTITVDASGTTEPRQQASLFWKTTGQVGEVNVQPGDHVSAGDVLMSIDPATAPANLLNAQNDLRTAQDALDSLLHPDAMTVANAQKSLADAYTAQDQARQALNTALSDANDSVSQDIAQALDDAQTALDNARTDFPLAAAGLDVQMLYRDTRTTDRAYTTYQNLEDQYRNNSQNAALGASVEAARQTYQDALDAQNALTDQVDSADVTKVNTLSDAVSTYDQAVNDFVNALSGNTAYDQSIAIVRAQANWSLAEEQLFDAITQLEHLDYGPAEADLSNAQTRVQAAQSTVDSLSIIAPFDGTVQTVNYAVGDTVTQNQAAVIEADVSVLHVTALVDETEIDQVQTGDTVNVTFSSRPDLTLTGTVTSIGNIGQTVQGLVKFPVEVTLDPTNENILLGSSADVSIVVDVQENVLAVPLDALQSDDQGEFVNRVGSDGTLERVPVVSGSLQGDQVVVTGNLSSGDTVQMTTPVVNNGFGGRLFGR